MRDDIQADRRIHELEAQLRTARDDALEAALEAVVQYRARVQADKQLSEGITGALIVNGAIAGANAIVEIIRALKGTPA